METRDWLNRVKKIDLQIKNKLVEKQQWKDIALGITANMDGERVQSSGSQQKMADAITKCIDMENEINALVDKLIDTKREVIAVIEQVKSPAQYDVLHMVYIQGLKLQEVADRYGMSYDWAATTHGRALQNVEEIRTKK
jgi:DNA-directed RNA polymerase specialized sigma24 family protein